MITVLNKLNTFMDASPLVDVDRMRSMTAGEQVQLHNELSVKKATREIEHTLFDLEDCIFRTLDQNPSAKDGYLTSIRDPKLTDRIQKYSERGSRFHPMKEGKIAPEKPAANLPDRSIKVLKLGFENSRNQIGGCGAVLLGLRAAHKKLDKDRVYSLHPLYSKDKPAARDYEFQGVITHFYDGEEVKSTIYKNRASNEYLVQPDDRFAEIFNIPLKNGAYEMNRYTNLQERTLYLGSAAASFAAQYRGKNGDKHIDILQSDTPAVPGCAFPLIQQFNKSRIEAQLPPIKTLNIVHDGLLQNKVFVSRDTMKRIGVDVSNRTETIYDLIGEGMKTAEKVSFVSSAIASEATSLDTRISYARNEVLNSEGKAVAIRNGVESDKFDVTNEAVYGKYALKRTFDSQGIETTDYVAYRNQLKEMLFEKGFIADPKLPLTLYVGRYAPEKGIDILADTIQKTDPKNSKAQFVTMGISTGGEEGHVRQLVNLSKSSHSNILRCITSLEDQKALFSPDSRASVGQILRAAADISIVPSHAEACGLVPMEARCAGALVVAPYHQGLKDTCQSDGYPNPSGGVYRLKQDANSVCYRDHSNFKQAREALAHAIDSWNKMSTEEQNQFARRIRNHAIPNYSWYYKNPDNGTITGAVVAYNKLYQELAQRNINAPELVPPVQAPIIPIPDTRSALLKIIQKIRTSVSRFFSNIKIFFKDLYKATVRSKPISRPKGLVRYASSIR